MPPAEAGFSLISFTSREARMSTKTRRATRVRGKKIALILAATAAAPLLSRAVSTDNWSDTTGNWSVASNWSLGRVPAAFDVVNLTQTDAITRAVTYDASATTGAGLLQ